MTPLISSTTNTMLTQHYLSRYEGQWLAGYFPWNGEVIVIVFDGSRSDSLQNIKANSVCSLLTVEAARQHWNERIKSEYTVVVPQDRAALTHVNTVHKLACAFIESMQSGKIEQTKSIQEMLNELFDMRHIPVIREYKDKYEQNSTTYALEA